MSAPRGLIVIDKPVGPTSHDVVGKLRRLFGTRRVGHAGTLDPMATGVLVALVGEATKLSTWLVLDDKSYLARVSFGRATDSLDATGKTTRQEAPPPWLELEIAALARGDHHAAPRLAAALDTERARSSQVPPSYSAIQRGGVRAHAAARAGRALDLDARHVVVRAIAVDGATTASSACGASPELNLALDVGKGYYVRSFARDLGEALGVPSCLEALRRTSSGPFDIASAATLEDLLAMPPDGRASRLVALADVARRAMRWATLTAEGLRKARMGQRLALEHFEAEPAPPIQGPFAWLDSGGELVSVGELREEAFCVLRNFDLAGGDPSSPGESDVLDDGDEGPATPEA